MKTYCAHCVRSIIVLCHFYIDSRFSLSESIAMLLSLHFVNLEIVNKAKNTTNESKGVLDIARETYFGPNVRKTDLPTMFSGICKASNLHQVEAGSQ